MKSTTDAEITLERLMAELGLERYWSKANAARAHRHQSETPGGKMLLKNSVDAVAVAVRAWVKAAQNGPGRKHNAVEYLSRLQPQVLAFLSVRSVIDQISRQNQLVSAAYALGNLLEEEVRYKAIAKTESKVWKDLKRRLKRANGGSKKREVIRDVATKLGVSLEAWPRKEKIRAGIVLIELVHQHTGLIELKHLTTAHGKTQTVITPAESTMRWLESSHAAHEALYPFWLPMVIPPADWENPWDGGYHTNLVTRRPIVKTRDRSVVEDLDRASMPEVYRAVNAMQRTAWEINPDVHEVAKHFWALGVPVADIPERVDEPAPPRPDVAADTDEFTAWRRASATRHQRVVAARSRRVLTAKILFMADRFRDVPKFYYPYQADFRGRLYPMPFFLQPQGPSLARGLLRFAEGRPLKTAEDVKWLAVHGANTYGVDKVSFEDRMKWVAENEPLFRLIHKDPVEERAWATADKPWEFLAWVLEWVNYLDSAGPFVSRIPVAMDGSNNGLQIFSLLMRDRVGAEATNCVASPRPRDIYQDVADIVTRRLQGSSDDMAAKWLEFVDGQLPRAATKRAVMTLPYGATFHACVHYVRDWYEETRRERGATPFERGYDSSVYLARHIWAAIAETVGSARACMDWMQGVAKAFGKAGAKMRWTAPTGFPVSQGYTKYLSHQIRTQVGDSIRWTNYRTDLADVDARKQVNGVSPNFVHSLDAAALARSVNLAYDAGVTSFSMVHDSYGVLAADASRMASALRAVYAEMFSEDLLGGLKRELEAYAPEGVQVPEPPERGDLDVNEVLRSPYFFA